MARTRVTRCSPFRPVFATPRSSSAGLDDWRCPSRGGLRRTLRPSGDVVHQLLPMAGQTHGNRSAVTCQLKCSSACAHPAPNPSTEPTFAEIARQQLSRRSVLISTGAIAAAARPLPTAGLALPAAAAPTARAAVRADRTRWPDGVDAFTVPSGYEWHTILRWGDPLFADSPAVQPGGSGRRGAGAAVRLQQRLSGHPGHRRPSAARLLCCNHEYVNPAIMFPPTADGGGRPGADQGHHGRRRVQRGRAAPQPARAGRGATSGAATATGGSPRTRRSPSPGRRRAATWSRRSPTRPAAGSRHLRQLRRRHHPVGHHPVRRGELQRLLPGRRHDGGGDSGTG